MSTAQTASPDQPVAFDPIEDAIAAIKRGEMVIVVDDESRENEGDLICAAERATPEAINFMARQGRGLICLAMERSQLSRFGLARMNKRGIEDAYSTAFMESVDAVRGVSTGISASDRAETIRVMIDERSAPQDIRSPGHLFPLEAVKGGVLVRPGHTESAVDLARLAGFKPAGVICEIIRDDGEMARLPDLLEFARVHGLRLVSVADLVAYRRRTEILVSLEHTTRMPTAVGMFDLRLYHSSLDEDEHLALVMGDPGQEESPLVRLHSECLTGDVFGSVRCDCGAQLDTSMRMIAERGCGVIVYLRQEGRGIGLRHKIHAYALQDTGLDTVEANEKLGFEADLRDYGIAAQILQEIGLSRLRLITNNPRKITGIERHGIEVSERVPLILPHTEHNARYLETKRTKLGHML